MVFSRQSHTQVCGKVGGVIGGLFCNLRLGALRHAQSRGQTKVTLACTQALEGRMSTVNPVGHVAFSMNVTSIFRRSNVAVGIVCIV